MCNTCFFFKRRSVYVESSAFKCKKTGYAPLRDKTTKGKRGIGAESLQDVQSKILKRVKAGSVLSSDSGPALVSAGKKLHGVPHITVVHSTQKNKGQWTKKCRLQLPRMSEGLKKTIAKHKKQTVANMSRSKHVVVRAGGEACEGSFGNIKQQMKRLGMHRANT